MLAKVDPYLRPLYDALHDMLDADRVAGHMDRGTIEVAPLAFMRGRTLNDSFVILDEAQNTTPEQMHMFLTRLGFGSKIVVTGDVTQIDLPREQTSGLVRVREILADVEGIDFVELGNQDVVRHVLVQRIVEAYKQHAERGRRVIVVEVENRSGVEVESEAAIALAQATLAAEGIEDGDLGIAFVDADESRALKREHLGIDEAADVLSFPIDEREPLADGVPRQLGDVVLCPQVVGRGVARAARPRPPAPARLRPRRRDGAPRSGARVVSQRQRRPSRHGRSSRPSSSSSCRRASRRASARTRCSSASTTRSRASSTSCAASATCASTSCSRP